MSRLQNHNMKQSKSQGAKWKTFRETLGFNQGEFWASVGITQSGGSRYESGRAIPRTVQMLLWYRWNLGIAMGDIKFPVLPQASTAGSKPRPKFRVSQS